MVVPNQVRATTERAEINIMFYLQVIQYIELMMTANPFIEPYAPNIFSK